MQIYLLLYSGLLLSGAYFGYKAGSKISMYMGLISALFTFLGLYMYQQNPDLGRSVLFGLTALLSAVFLKRLIATKKFMPAGMLLIFSLLALLASIRLP